MNQRNCHMLTLLVPCGAMLAFGALTNSHTIMTSVAEMGAPLDVTAKNVLGRSVITAWTGVAGAVLFCVGMYFAMASARQRKGILYRLPSIGFLSGATLIGLVNVHLFNAFRGVANAELITASMVRERIGASGHVILMGFGLIVAASVCMGAVITLQKGRLTRQRNGWARLIVFCVSALLLVGGTCLIAQSSSIFVFAVNQPGGVRLAHVAGCVASDLLATILALVGVLGFGVLTLDLHGVRLETLEPSETGCTTGYSECTNVDL